MEFNCYLSNTCKKAINNTCDGESCVKLFKLNYLFDQALLSEKQRQPHIIVCDKNGSDYKNFKELDEITKNIKSFVNDGKNVYIHSAICGNGKTLWAVRFIQEYLRSIWVESDFTCRALFIHVPRFLLGLKDSITNRSEYIEHIKQNVLNADLVIWDEIGVKSLTPYEHEHLLNLINTRLDMGKSNIYTSNLNGEALRESLGERLYSRVVNLSHEFVFLDEDKRILEIDPATIY